MVEKENEDIEKGETHRKLFSASEKYNSKEEVKRRQEESLKSRKNISKAGISAFKSSQKIFVPKKSGGFSRIKTLKTINSEWSDLGLVSGSPFKNYESRSILPRSTPDRTLHPQEKAEFAILQAKKKLFGERLF